MTDLKSNRAYVILSDDRDRQRGRRATYESSRKQWQAKADDAQKQVDSINFMVEVCTKAEIELQAAIDLLETAAHPVDPTDSFTPDE
jgi:hypothetical protein